MKALFITSKLINNSLIGILFAFLSISVTDAPISASVNSYDSPSYDETPPWNAASKVDTSGRVGIE